MHRPSAAPDNRCAPAALDRPRLDARAVPPLIPAASRADIGRARNSRFVRPAEAF